MLTNISCKVSKYIVFFQDFANFKTFLRAKKRVKERSKVADIDEGKFVFSIAVLFAL
jgi:hypothetical protein